MECHYGYEQLMPSDKQNFREWIVNLRNDFHRHPELSGQETRTSQKIAGVLESLNARVTTFDDITGVVGLFTGDVRDGGTPRTLALRADIDALPMQELSGHSHTSVNAGVMHACGHDANTAILLGIAKKIIDSGLLEKINGSVKFIFQPSEERLGGARAMIERGVLDNPGVDRMIAGHMDPNFPVGTVGVFTRIGHAASDPFQLTITGKGAHGARPHKGINPITAGGLFVTGIEAIVSRHVKPSQSAVVSVGAFHAGEAGNVIPETAVINGSVRTHDEAVRSRIFEAMHQLVKGIEAMMGVRCELVFKPGAPFGINDEEACRSLYQASAAVLGEENVTVLPFIMGSDDFYYFAGQCPAAMMRFGCADRDAGESYPLHSPKFTIQDDVLEVGVNVLFRAVEAFFLE